MDRRILVPLDGTAVGEAVLPKLDELLFRATPRIDAEVTLLHVISPMNFNMLSEDSKAQLPIPESELKEQKEKAEEYLKGVAQRMASNGIAVKTMVAVGHAADEIVKAARETKANLIAMSTHGHNGLVKWMLGSVSDRVLRLEGTIPVLAMKAKEEHSPVIAMGSLHSMMKHSLS